jgi:DNA-directed RNA polymerase specialized sigma24 family protein
VARPPHRHAARLARPDVRAAILGAISRKIPPADRDDVVQKVYEALLLLDELPETDLELVKLAVFITKHKVIDHFRGDRRKERREVDVDGLEEELDADRTALGKADVRVQELLRAVDHEIAGGKLHPSVAAIARGFVDGKTFEEIAAEEGIPVATAKSRYQRALAHLRKNWQAYVAAGVVGAFLAFFLVVRRPAPQEAIGPEPSTTFPWKPAASASAAAIAKQAQDLRDQATAACDAFDFYDCERLIEAAQNLDPTTRDRPDMQDLEKRVEEGMAPHGKPNDRK